MGCQQTKMTADDVNGGYSVIPEPNAPPPVDPRLPLNARQVFRIQKSWKGIKRNMEGTGVEMFIA